MQTATTNLDKNLDAIYRYNSTLVSTIKNHSKANGQACFINTASGDVDLIYNDTPLHGGENPYLEPIELMENLSRNDSRDTVFIYGIGLGYAIKRFSEKYKGGIVIFEPCLDILRVTLEAVDFSQDFKKNNILITHLGEDLSRYITNFYKDGGQCHFVTLDSYKQLFPVIYKQLKDEMNVYMPPKYTGGDIKLNLGPGRWSKKGWHTLDCYRYASLTMDLRSHEKIPIDDNKIIKAFCSHCIEHIENSHAQNLFKELYRTMKPGAIFRVSCPDAQMALDAYEREDRNWFKWLPENNLGAMLVNTFVSYERGGPPVDDETVKEKYNSLSREDFMEWCISLKDKNRPYIAHTNWYTWEKLSKMLEDSGFVNIRRSGYKQSYDAELRQDGFDGHISLSLYVECQKPE